MDSKIIQKRIDDLAKAMVAKGMREPAAQVSIRSSEEPQAYLRWKSGLGRDRYSHEKYQFFSGEMGKALDDALAFVAEQPNAEQAKIQDFMAALGSVIDIGRQHNIEVAFLNPLTETMKRLSENAITDQRAA